MKQYYIYKINEMRLNWLNMKLSTPIIQLYLAKINEMRLNLLIIYIVSLLPFITYSHVYLLCPLVEYFYSKQTIAKTKQITQKKTNKVLSSLKI